MALWYPFYLSLSFAAPPGGEAVALQAIQWGAARDLVFNSSGGASVLVGPLNTTLVRISYIGTGSVRVAIGVDTSVAAAATSTLMGGSPFVEHVVVPFGGYVAALSNDASGGTLNITQAL